MSDDIRVQTVIAKSVGEKDTPDWYNPNDYFKEVNMIFPDGESRLVNTDIMKDSRIKELAKYQRRDEYADMIKEFIDRLMVSDKKKNEEIQMFPKQGSDSIQEFGIKKSRKPNKCVTLLVHSLNITACYHDIIYADPYLIFVFDTESEYPKVFFNGKEPVDLLINDEKITIVPIGLTFTHEKTQFCVTLCKHKNEDSSEEEVVNVK